MHRWGREGHEKEPVRLSEKDKLVRWEESMTMVSWKPVKEVFQEQGSVVSFQVLRRDQIGNKN